MNKKFMPCDRNTLYLLPPCIQDWLPKDHLARFVVEVVGEIDLSEIEKEYASGGGRAYPVQVMMALIFYGYVTGVFSSRKIERATYDSIAFRFVAADLHPDHDSIASFRQKFSCKFDGIFNQILLMAAEMGFLKLGNISVDGTKIKANASKHKALSWKYVKQLEEKMNREVKELMAKASEADNKDHNEQLNIPKELERRSDRLVEIRRAKEEIKKRAEERAKVELEVYNEKMKQRAAKEAAGKKCRSPLPKMPTSEPKDTDQVNLVDEESRIMPKSGSKDFEQAYNAQLAVDQDSMLIVSNNVTQNTNDKKEVAPALEKVKQVEGLLGQQCQSLVGDAGYFSEANVVLCEKAQITPLFVDKREKHNSWLEHQNIAPVSDNDVAAENDPVLRMQKRLQTSTGKKIYAKRKSTVEPVFGSIKSNMGYKSFLRRGLEAAKAELEIISIAWNIKRLFGFKYGTASYAAQ